MKYKNDPKFWALIGFCVGAVLASAGSISNPLDSILGGLVQSGIWFLVSRQIIKSKSAKANLENEVIADIATSTKSTLFLFDRPVHKDWMFYIFLFSLFSNIVGGLKKCFQFWRADHRHIRNSLWAYRCNFSSFTLVVSYYSSNIFYSKKNTRKKELRDITGSWQ